MTYKSMVIQHMDDVAFRLAKTADLSFIQEYGRVFRVFDDHDSGNISFGVDDGTRKRFIKIAGVRTVEAGISTQAAIDNLRKAERVYRDIAHPNIVRCIDTIEHGPYFGLIFDWVDGELLRRVNEATFARFRALPISERMAAFETVVATIQQVHDAGYVAIDFYDASFLYDFDHKQMIICDADVYERKPMVNTMGRMWGSSRFMSPEEYELGAPIDEVTNVYTLGAVSFLFFGDERERSLVHWDADEPRYAVAKQAVSDAREDRHQSIADFGSAWSG